MGAVSTYAIDRESVVFCTEDATGALAARLANARGAQCIEWSQDSDMPAAVFKSSMTLLLLLDHPKNHSRYKQWSRTVWHTRRAHRLGIILGHDLQDLDRRITQLSERAIQPQSAAETEVPTRSWVIVDRALAPHLTVSAEIIPGDVVEEVMLIELAQRNAPFGVLVGHGREDVLYFDGRGFCGQDQGSGFPFTCHPSQCSYRFPKFQLSLLRARILVLLSCNSGRLGPGLFHASHRLAMVASRQSQTVIAAIRLFTMSCSLIEQVTANLSSGMCAGDVALRANRLQARIFGELDVFVVFGDPAICAAEREVTYPAQVPVSLAARRVALEELAIMQNMVDALSALRLGGKALEAVMAVLNTASNALYSTGLREIGSYRSAMRESVDTLLSAVGIELLQLTERQPFWVSTRYIAVPGLESSCQCWICGSEAVSTKLNHHRFNFLSRQRVTCSVCGVIADTPASLRWDAVRLSRPTLTCTNDDSTICDSTLVLPNKQTSAIVFAAVNGLEGSSDCIELDSALRGYSDMRTFSIALQLQGLRPGIWFIKIYVLSTDGLAEVAAPIHVGESHSSQLMNIVDLK